MILPYCWSFLNNQNIYSLIILFLISILCIYILIYLIILIILIFENNLKKFIIFIYFL